MSKKKILIFGLGYVGTSLALLFAQSNRVDVIDPDEKKIEKLNRKISPIEDPLSKELLKDAQDLNGYKSIEELSNIKDYDVAIICVPTNYDEIVNSFNTDIVEDVIKDLVIKKINFPILIKSTIPIGFTDKSINKFMYEKIIFSPEFLREGNAIHDNLYPSRIVVSGQSPDSLFISNLLLSIAKNKPDIIETDHKEAESIKLFSNTYLALRVSYFNELDSFCLKRNLDSEKVIKAVSLDKRIGDFYNNPSFGYGGYCLPKDTKQLLANYNDVPQNLIEAVVRSNDTRKKFLAEHILLSEPKTVGIYRLTMKDNSDNIRESSLQGVLNILKAKGVDMLIYEPLIEESKYLGISVTKSLDDLKSKSCIILTNRLCENLSDVQHKIYTRDIFTRD